MERRNQITAKQLGIFILSAQVGLGFITLPATLVQEVGHDGWIPILSAGLISTIAIVPIMSLLKRYSDQSIFEISRHLFGKFLGQTVNYILLLYLCFLMIAGFRYFTEFVKLFTLEVTPGLAIALLIIIPTAYLTWYGLKALARFSSIIMVILVFILVLAFLVLNRIRLTFLMPIGAADLTALIHSITPSLLPFIGLELAVFVYPYVSDKKNALKSVVAANLVAMIFFIIIFLVTTGLFGENLLKSQIAPLFNLSRYYRVPFIGRVDLFFILLWFPLLEGTFRAYFFTTYNSLRRIFPFQNQKVFFGLFVALTILLSRIPADLVQVFKLAEIVSISGITTIAFLILCYLFSFIKKRGVKAG